MKVIDLFSGLGGFSQAFLDRGHDVTRYEFDMKHQDVPCTILEDILNLEAKDLEGADIILASPPCTHFSLAANTKGGSRHWPKNIPTKETLQQIDLVKYTIQIIKETNPTYWILENPRGRMRWILGKPSMETTWAAWGTPYLKPTHLWGKLPPIEWKMTMKWQPNPSGGVGNASKSDPYPRNPSKRALIPYDFSLAVCLAAEGNSQQRTIQEFTQ